MKAVSIIVAVALFVAGSVASPVEPGKVFELIKKGKSLPESEAQNLENSLKANPEDGESRIQLLAYYSSSRAGADIPAAKAARSRHIFWLIENDPKRGLGLFPTATGIHRLNCQGDELADAEAFRRAAELWEAQLRKYPDDTEVKRSAAAAVQFCMPETAEQLLIPLNDSAALGRFYAATVLGITGMSYDSNYYIGTDPKFRQRPFTAKAKRILENLSDKKMAVEAALTLLRHGGILWADGKLDWDYTSLGASVLEKAKSLAPEELNLYTLQTQLPARGERPPVAIRVGGNVQGAKLVFKTNPTYPKEARKRGIQGVVRMTALIGLDGEVIQLQPESGPEELIPGSLEAVRLWKYQPTLLNGKPCYVITRIDVNYSLQQR